VEYIIDRLAQGATAADLVDEYDGLTREDVAACLLFAEQALLTMEILPLADASC
jgi:uncharacterized protein (DUF433 family)